jgi:hypothetical protein
LPGVAQATTAALSVVFMHGLERLEPSLTLGSISPLPLPLPPKTQQKSTKTCAGIFGSTCRPTPTLTCQPRSSACLQRPGGVQAPSPNLRVRRGQGRLPRHVNVHMAPGQAQQLRALTRRLPALLATIGCHALCPPPLPLW